MKKTDLNKYGEFYKVFEKNQHGSGHFRVIQDSCLNS